MTKHENKQLLKRRVPLKNLVPLNVSPGFGSLGARETKSIMQLPTTVTSKFPVVAISFESEDGCNKMNT